jgi:lipid-binding SYLF domain-containing protein
MRARSAHMILAVIVAAAAIVPLACKAPEGDTRNEQRQSVRQMRDEALADLYRERADAKGASSEAVGYAVFSSLGTNIGLLSTARGYGILHDNRNGKETYMKMMSLGGGVGIGVKDYRIVFFFYDADAMDQFREVGVDFSGQADAAVQQEDEKGIDLNAAQNLHGTVAKVAVFQMTEKGLAAQATLQGTKYSVDDDLN